MKHKLWSVFAVIVVLAATAFFVVRSAEDKVTAVWSVYPSRTTQKPLESAAKRGKI